MNDPLSDVLLLMQVRNVKCTRLEAQGNWGLSFATASMLKFVTVLRGSCWITGVSDLPCRLDEGDAFLLINACGYGVSSDPDVAMADGDRLFQSAQSNVVRLGGSETVLIGGSFIVQGDDLSPLLDVLPSFFAIRTDNPAIAALKSTILMLDAEMDRGDIGGPLMKQHLANMMLIQAIRAFCATAHPDDLSWISALGDKHIGAALTLMHTDPGFHWTVAGLAGAVCLSRSSFAARFKARVGLAPLEYLLRWRMQRARHTLRTAPVPISRLASDLGYSSESAFSFAFKRVVGQAPKQYSTTCLTAANGSASSNCQ